MERKKKCNGKNKFKYLKGARGITLIALVITIIVLLILAGVTIATLTGENGILTRANDAKNKTEQAEKDEKTNLSRTEDIINQYVDGIEVEQVTDTNPGVLEGTGTNEDPYTINSIEDLVFFAYDVREGNTYEGKTVKLGLSLDFNSSKSYVDSLRTDYGQYGYDGELKTLLTSGEGFKPIGTESYLEAEVAKVNTFKGTFDGDNKVIYSLYIDRDITYNGDKYEEYSIGLFGYNEGIIENFGIANNNIKVEKVSGNCNIFVGGIVGKNQGMVDNTNNQGKIMTNARVGGISGRNNGTIENSYNSGKILGDLRVGGISGDGSGNFVNCYNLGDVSSDNSTTEIYIAGISTSGNNISKCYNTGNITVTSSTTALASGVGGAETIDNCYNLGDVTAIVTEFNDFKSATAAGICAHSQKTIKSCYNVGKVTTNSNSYYSVAGGIARSCTIDNSYNFGIVLGIGEENTENQVGGISGDAGNKNIANSYNVGSIQFQGGKSILLGAILGAGGETGRITNCSYLASTAEKGMATGTDVTTRVNNIEDMPDILTVLGSEFKEDTNNINNGYPILAWQ